MRGSAGTSWQARGLPALALLAAALATGCSGASNDGVDAAKSCLPADLAKLRLTSDPAAAPGRDPRTQRLDVYWDGSKSMAGYANQRPEVNSPGNLIEQIARVQRAVGASESEFRAFGSRVGEAPVGNPRIYANPAQYSCKTCDRLESRIEEPLRRVLDQLRAAKALKGEAAKQPSQAPRLAMVVTDLWPDAQDATADKVVRIGGPLRDLLREGQAVGILGIPSAYDGPIYFREGEVAQRAARLLFVLLIGAPADVAAAYQAISSSEAKGLSPDRTHFALFSLADPAVVLSAPRAEQAAAPGGIDDDAVAARFGQAPQFKLAAQGAGGLVASLDPMRGVAPYLIAPRTPIRVARRWKMSASRNDLLSCGVAAWSASAPMPDTLWRADGDTLRFTLDPAGAAAAGLEHGASYFVLAMAGTGGSEIPADATDWMGPQEWSAASDSQRAASAGAKVKTPGLDRLRDVLTGDVREAAAKGQWRAASGFVVTVE